jgi:hypothetical protein
MTLITGDERRRRWSDEERARVLAAIEEPGAERRLEGASRQDWRVDAGDREFRRNYAVNLTNLFLRRRRKGAEVKARV